MTDQQKVDAWNKRYAIGQAVAVRRGEGQVLRTRTRSSAQLLSGHTAVIWVDGIAGCYLLDRVSAVSPAEEVQS